MDSMWIAQQLTLELLALRGTGRSFTIEVGEVYFQAASYDANQVLIEVPAASFLPEDHHLPPNGEQELLRLGFSRPTPTMPNWWIGVEDGRGEALFGAALATTRALLDIYRVPLEALVEVVACDS